MRISLSHILSHGSNRMFVVVFLALISIFGRNFHTHPLTPGTSTVHNIGATSFAMEDSLSLLKTSDPNAC